MDPGTKTGKRQVSLVYNKVSRYPAANPSKCPLNRMGTGGGKEREGGGHTVPTSIQQRLSRPMFRMPNCPLRLPLPPSYSIPYQPVSLSLYSKSLYLFSYSSTPYHFIPPINLSISTYPSYQSTPIPSLSPISPPLSLISIHPYPIYPSSYQSTCYPSRLLPRSVHSRRDAPHLRHESFIAAVRRGLLRGRLAPLARRPLC